VIFREGIPFGCTHLDAAACLRRRNRALRLRAETKHRLALNRELPEIVQRRLTSCWLGVFMVSPPARSGPAWRPSSHPSRERPCRIENRLNLMQLISRRKHFWASCCLGGVSRGNSPGSCVQGSLPQRQIHRRKSPVACATGLEFFPKIEAAKPLQLQEILEVERVGQLPAHAHLDT